MTAEPPSTMTGRMLVQTLLMGGSVLGSVLIT